MKIQSLGWEDPLEKEMATHSYIVAWKIPWTEKSGLQSKESDTTAAKHERTHEGHATVLNLFSTFFVLQYIDLTWLWEKTKVTDFTSLCGQRKSLAKGLAAASAKRLRVCKQFIIS